MADDSTYDPSDFALPQNAPMGMRNNNPLNIKYYKGAPYAGLVGPSINTDQGDPQMVFQTPQHGWNAAYSLLSRKYNSGKTTPDQIIAGQGGWTPGNHQAAANVARMAGIGPNDDINFSNPAKAQAFMRALVIQEQGGAAHAYPDAMISAAVSGAPVKFAGAAARPSPGPGDASIKARGGVDVPLPSDTPGTTLTSTPVATAPPTGRFAGGATTQAASNLEKQAQKAISGEAFGEQGQTPELPQFNPMMPQAYGPRAVGPQGGAMLGIPQMMSQAVTGYQPPPPYGTGLTSIGAPMESTMASPGAPAPYTLAGQQGPVAGFGGAMPGTTLTSLQQLQMMDPQRFALLYGDQGQG